MKCNYCEKDMMPVKPKISILTLIFLLTMGFLPGIIYYINWLTKPAVMCPYCKKNYTSVNYGKKVELKLALGIASLLLSIPAIPVALIFKNLKWVEVAALPFQVYGFYQIFKFAFMRLEKEGAFGQKK